MTNKIFNFTLIILITLFNSTITRAQNTSKTPVLITLDYNDLIRNKEDLKGGKPEVTASYKKIITTANAILKREPLKVTDGVMPPSGNKNDFFTIAKYAWPNPDTPDGMPYQTRDGYINPESSGDNYDLNRYNKTVFNVMNLVAAWFFSDDEKYAKKAAELLRVWFINPETRMNPNFEYAGALPGVYNGTFSGIIYGAVLINMLDYVKILNLSSNWSCEDDKALKKWFTEYTNWLQTSDFGIKESNTTNNHSVYYASQIASFAIYNNDTELAKSMFEKGKKMVDQQITTDGSLPRELGRNLSFHYSLYGLKAFCILADCARVIGEDLWNFTTADGRSIRQAVDFILPYLLKEKDWGWPNISKDDEKNRINAIQFIRPAAKVYRTETLKRTEAYITSIAPKDLDKVWLLGRNTDITAH